MFYTLIPFYALIATSDTQPRREVDMPPPCVCLSGELPFLKSGENPCLIPVKELLKKTPFSFN